MTIPQNDVITIPQDILDRYNAAYNNKTYRRFGNALAAYLPAGQQDHDRIMNLLIDACYDRLGAEFFRGACALLGTALIGLGDNALLVQAEAHLRAFTSTEAEEDGLLTMKLLVMLEQIRTLAQDAAVLAAEHQHWSGRAAISFYWLNAVAHLLAGIAAVLRRDKAFRVQEKLIYAIRALANGVHEGAENSPQLAQHIVAWFRNAPRY